MEIGEENCSGDWGGTLLWSLERKTVVKIGDEFLLEIWEENCGGDWEGNCNGD